MSTAPRSSPAVGSLPDGATTRSNTLPAEARSPWSTSGWPSDDDAIICVAANGLNWWDCGCSRTAAAAAADMTSHDVDEGGSKEANGKACRRDDKAAVASISYASDDDTKEPDDVDDVVGKKRLRSGG